MSSEEHALHEERLDQEQATEQEELVLRTVKTRINSTRPLKVSLHGQFRAGVQGGGWKF